VPPLAARLYFQAAQVVVRLETFIMTELMKTLDFKTLQVIQDLQRRS
jgi:hypothetical protein